MCSKIIATEAVFIKTETNNEWIINFLINTKWVQKVWTLKLYLPRQKSTMNETLIFFNVWSMLKKYRDWRQKLQEVSLKVIFMAQFRTSFSNLITLIIFRAANKINFYHWRFSDYCLHLYCYFYHVSADMSSGLLQVFVELGNLQQDA